MKHTTNAELSISDIRNITQLTYDFIQDYEMTAKNLLGKPANKVSAMRVFKSVWPLPPEVEDMPYNMLDQGQRKQFTIATVSRAKALDIYEHSPTQENLHGTMFGVWQSVVEFTDHYSKGNITKRAVATISGKNDRLKDKALALVSA